MFTVVHVCSRPFVTAAAAAAAAAESLQSCPTLCDPINRLPHPWDSPGKTTGVGFHVLLQSPLLSTSILLSHFSHLIIKTAYEVGGQSSGRIKIKTKFLDSKSSVSTSLYSINYLIIFREQLFCLFGQAYSSDDHCFWICPFTAVSNSV